MTVLTTERLVMTPVAVSDHEDLLAAWRDPALYGPIIGRPMTGEEVWMRLLRDIGHWSTLGHGNWALRLKDGGDYVGAVGVLDYRRDVTPALDAPELGWGLVGAHQGQGLALEAVVAALAWADETMPAPRTVCMISPDNAASLRLAARAGYSPYAEAVFKDAPITLLERARP